MQEKDMNDKELVCREIDRLQPELNRLSDAIFQNPEYCYREYKACAAVSALLERFGFRVEAGAGGLETALRAEYDSGKPGPNLGFVCEYDAVPGMGHACGHNIMAPIAVGAAKALQPVCDRFGGRLTVVGTPAEEGGGGKVVLLKKGVFDGLDAAMLIHAANETVVNDISYSVTNVLVDFYGKKAHAATWPEEGISALIPVVELINILQALRMETAEKGKILGIITKGGDEPIMIPDHCQASLTVRSFSGKNKRELLDRLLQICRHLAEITRTRLEYRIDGLPYEDIRNNEVLEEYLEKNFRVLGEPVMPRRRELGIGCTDMGNVTQVIPGLQSYIQVVPKLRGHTKEFEDACGGPAGYRAVSIAAKAVAMTGVDLLSDPGALERVRDAFRGMRETMEPTEENHGQ